MSLGGGAAAGGSFQEFTPEETKKTEETKKSIFKFLSAILKLETKKGSMMIDEINILFEAIDAMIPSDIPEKADREAIAKFILHDLFEHVKIDGHDIPNHKFDLGSLKNIEFNLDEKTGEIKTKLNSMQTSENEKQLLEPYQKDEVKRFLYNYKQAADLIKSNQNFNSTYNNLLFKYSKHVLKNDVDIYQLIGIFLLITTVFPLLIISMSLQSKGMFMASIVMSSPSIITEIIDNILVNRYQKISKKLTIQQLTEKLYGAILSDVEFDAKKTKIVEKITNIVGKDNKLIANNKSVLPFDKITQMVEDTTFKKSASSNGTRSIDSGIKDVISECCPRVTRADKIKLERLLKKAMHIKHMQESKNPSVDKKIDLGLYR